MAMTEENEKKNRWKAFTEEVEVAGHQLVEEVTRLIAEGNVRKLRLRSQNDDIVLEIPLTAGAVVGGVVVLTAPWLAVLGALAGLLVKVRIEVVREVPPEDDRKDGDTGPEGDDTP
jgi:phage terminase large subunit-like protein